MFSNNLINNSISFQILLNYLGSLGCPKEEYKVFAGWPRKDVSRRGRRRECVVDEGNQH